MDNDLLEKLSKSFSAVLVYNKKTLKIVGEYEEWVNENPEESISPLSDFAVVELGGSVGLSDYSRNERIALGLESFHKKMLYNYQQEQFKRLDEARSSAPPVLEKVSKQIKSILKENNAFLDCRTDDYGNYKYIYIIAEIEGFTIEKEI